MRHSINIAAIVLIVLTSAAASVSAQNSQRYLVDVPFDFSVKGEQMKAGRYTLETSSEDSSVSVLGLVSRETGRTKLIKPVIRGAYDHNVLARLSFVRRGGMYALAGVITPDFTTMVGPSRSTPEPLIAGKTEIASVYLRRR